MNTFRAFLAAYTATIFSMLSVPIVVQMVLSGIDSGNAFMFKTVFSSICMGVAIMSWIEYGILRNIELNQEASQKPTEHVQRSPKLAAQSNA